MVISNFHPAVGGAENQALRLAREIVKKGMEILVLTRSVQGLQRRENCEGVEIFRSIVAPQWGFLYGLCYLASSFLFFWKKRREYDVIHCHILYLHTVAAVLIGRLFNKKVVVKTACSGEFGDVRSMRKLRGAGFLLAICRKADRFVAVSREAADELRSIGVEDARITMVPNFVDTALFRPALRGERRSLAERLGVAPERRLVTYVGRLAPQKGLGDLIGAWARASAASPSSVLLIVGKGDQKGELEARTRALGISDAVRFLGERHDIPDILRASDLFVLPSLSEGLPGSLLEAMACGLPCVATRIGGVVDIIEEGKDGLLVGRGCSDELAAALLGLLLDRERAARLGRGAREKVEQQYTVDYALAQYARLYGGLA